MTASRTCDLRLLAFTRRRHEHDPSHRAFADDLAGHSAGVHR